MAFAPLLGVALHALAFGPLLWVALHDEPAALALAPLLSVALHAQLVFGALLWVALHGEPALALKSMCCSCNQQQLDLRHRGCEKRPTNRHRPVGNQCDDVLWPLDIVLAALGLGHPSATGSQGKW